MYKIPTTMAAPLPSALLPIAPQERLVSLDVLRGFALFGILIVNIMEFSPDAVSPIDRAVRQTITVMAEGTFFPLFSLLFGVGFAVFLGRAADAGRNPLPFYLRRVIGLFVIAVLQFVFLEDRNILLRYAYLAIPLMLFWRATPRVCLIATALFLALAAGRGAAHVAATRWETTDPQRAEPIKAAQTAAQIEQKQRLAAYQQAAESRSFSQFVGFRARWQLANSLEFSANFRRNQSLFVILAMFTLGVALWRVGVFLDTAVHHRMLRFMLIVGGIIGVAGNLYMTTRPEVNGNRWLNVWWLAATMYAGNVALTLAYVAAIMLLCLSASAVWHSISSPLATIGRMALTNYLWQSVAMSALFLPYGANLEGKVPAWGLALIAGAIFVAGWAVSGWWMARFRFGPAEWLWRCITYAQLQPLRNDALLPIVSKPAVDY
jgi:uncharacterized protein